MRTLSIALLCAALIASQARAAADEPVASPAEQAFDARVFAGLAAQAEALPDLRSLVVLRLGRMAFEYHRSGQDRATLQPVESVTKSVLSLLVGIAVAQGRIASPDQPVLAMVPQRADANDDLRAQRLTVRHLLTMTAGFQPSDRRVFDAKERERFAMGRRFEAEPGTRLRYDNPAADLLVAALAQAVGETAAACAQRELFAPLGIEASDWARDEQGQHPCFRGLALRTRDMARIGQLMLQRGRWAGRDLLPEDFALQASARQTGGGPRSACPMAGSDGWRRPTPRARPSWPAASAASSSGSMWRSNWSSRPVRRSRRTATRAHRRWT